MNRLAAGVFLICVPLLAQTAAAPQSDPLESVALKRSAEWDALAKGLEARIARMLPCDPRARAAVEEVSHASEARLAAVSAYLEAAAARGRSDADRARAALAAENAAAVDANQERMEAEQQRVAVDAQIADLSDSEKRRGALEDARQKLTQIRAKIDERIARAQGETAAHAALKASLEKVSAAYDARQKAIAAEISSLASETARWNEYYLARLARAQTECSITNQVGRRKP